MEKRIGYDQISLDSDVKVDETDDEIVFKDVVIAREIVQPYDVNGEKMFAYKAADELEACYWTGEGQWIRMDAHPPNLVIDRRDEVHGQMRNLRFVKNLKDHKTKRPNQRGVMADLHFFKRQLSETKQDELKALKNRDVSIGFFYTPVMESGKWNGADYDFRQTDILLNHLAAPIPVGRCTMPYCGIGADEAVDRYLTGDPEETEEKIHIPVRDKGQFVGSSFRTISLSKEQGIQAVIGKLKSDPDGSTKIQKYIFDKGKGWTMEKAKSWIKEHKDEAYEVLRDALRELIPSDALYNVASKMIDAVEATKDLSLEQIESKVEELRGKRDDVQAEINKFYAENPQKEMPTELDKLYGQLHDVEMELQAYMEAKALKISGGDAPRTEEERARSHFNISKEEWEKLSEEEKQAYIDKLPPRGSGGDWVKAIDWKMNRQAFDQLPEELQTYISDLGLCPDCGDSGEGDEENSDEGSVVDEPEIPVPSTRELLRRKDLYED